MNNLILVLLSALFLLKTDNNPGKWELVTKSNGISSYVRWVKVNEQLSVRERKAEFIVIANVEKVLFTITDATEAKKWMKNVKRNEVLKRINTNEYILYTLFDLPWPFDNRDLVSKYVVNYNSELESYNVVIESKENMYKTIQSAQRIEKYKATWTIAKTTNGSKITFSAITYTPPEMPRYIQDPVMERTFHQNMLNLKNLLENK